jgi:Pvc16 N-terminal domain
VISEVDAALSALLQREVLESAQVPVVLDAPTKEWAAKRSGPTVNLFLYDIREDLRRRGSGMYAHFDDNGRIVSRRQLPRVFRLGYLVTAWTQRPEDEHRLLGALLSSLLAHDQIPPDLLSDSPSPATVTVGIPPEEDRSFADVWSALGGELRPSIDVVVSVPVPAGRPLATEKLVLEPLYADVERRGAPAARERVGGPSDERS